MKLTPSQRTALELAASRKSGCVSSGHGFPTPSSTLRALRKRSFVTHVATVGTYCTMQIQYRITDAGRAAIVKISAAACARCGGWASFGGMGQHHNAITPVLGRTGCTC